MHYATMNCNVAGVERVLIVSNRYVSDIDLIDRLSQNYLITYLLNYYYGTTVYHKATTH